MQQHYDGQRLETACDLCGDTGALCAKVCAADSQNRYMLLLKDLPDTESDTHGVGRWCNVTGIPMY